MLYCDNLCVFVLAYDYITNLRVHLYYLALYMSEFSKSYMCFAINTNLLVIWTCTINEK